jgi:hypothetical protein
MSNDRDDEPEPQGRIGYRRPPKHSRFKPGQSGNLKGRPKRRVGPKDHLGVFSTRRLWFVKASGFAK